MSVKQAAFVMGILLGIATLGGCKSAPELKTVDSSATEQPINSTSSAQRIQQKYAK
jgi:hypothetical protein